MAAEACRGREMCWSNYWTWHLAFFLQQLGPHISKIILRCALCIKPLCYFLHWLKGKERFSFGTSFKFFCDGWLQKWYHIKNENNKGKKEKQFSKRPVVVQSSQTGSSTFRKGREGVQLVDAAAGPTVSNYLKHNMQTFEHKWRSRHVAWCPLFVSFFATQNLINTIMQQENCLQLVVEGN